MHEQMVERLKKHSWLYNWPLPARLLAACAFPSTCRQTPGYRINQLPAVILSCVHAKGVKTRQVEALTRSKLCSRFARQVGNSDTETVGSYAVISMSYLLKGKLMARAPAPQSLASADRQTDGRTDEGCRGSLLASNAVNDWADLVISFRQPTVVCMDSYYLCTVFSWRTCHLCCYRAWSLQKHHHLAHAVCSEHGR